MPVYSLSENLPPIKYALQSSSDMRPSMFAFILTGNEKFGKKLSSFTLTRSELVASISNISGSSKLPNAIPPLL